MDECLNKFADWVIGFCLAGACLIALLLVVGLIRATWEGHI